MSDNATAPEPLILLTRPREASERFAAALRRELGPIRVVIAPLMEIVPTGLMPDIEEASALIFTSAAGVETFGRLSARRDLPAWCVGARTAQAAQEIGLAAQSADGDADALVALILADRRTHRTKGRLVHLCGTHSRGEVAGRLQAAGLRAEAQAIYDQTALGSHPGLIAALGYRGPILVPLFSPRSATLFAQAAMGAAQGADVFPVALSPAVRAALPIALAAQASLADSPDAPAMIRALAAMISRHCAT